MKIKRASNPFGLDFGDLIGPAVMIGGVIVLLGAIEGANPANLLNQANQYVKNNVQGNSGINPVPSPSPGSSAPPDTTVQLSNASEYPTNLNNGEFVNVVAELYHSGPATQLWLVFRAQTQTTTLFKFQTDFMVNSDAGLYEYTVSLPAGLQVNVSKPLLLSSIVVSYQLYVVDGNGNKLAQIITPGTLNF